MCGQTTFVVTDYAEQFVWDRYGLKLRIPENSLPKDVEKCTVSIGASIAGLYQFPENFHLVSAVVWFRCEPICKFTKSITMEMEHCAKLKNSSKLSFMRAKCSQETLPYTFKKIGGRFASDRHFGSIELNGFSGLGIVQEESQNKQQDSSPCPEREYGARLYHHCTHKNVIRYNIDFVVIWNTSAHLTVSFIVFYCTDHFCQICRLLSRSMRKYMLREVLSRLLKLNPTGLLWTFQMMVLLPKMVGKFHPLVLQW